MDLAFSPFSSTDPSTSSVTGKSRAVGVETTMQFVFSEVEEKSMTGFIPKGVYSDPLTMVLHVLRDLS